MRQHHGKPSRNGYHNTEWADKMEAVGLIPSSTGQPGGKRTGQSMGDYAAKGPDQVSVRRLRPQCLGQTIRQIALRRL